MIFIGTQDPYIRKTKYTRCQEDIGSTERQIIKLVNDSYSVTQTLILTPKKIKENVDIVTRSISNSAIH